jgi:ABC-type sugar transport system permease subunit
VIYEPAWLWQRDGVDFGRLSAEKSAETPPLSPAPLTRWQRLNRWRHNTRNRHTLEAWIILTPVLIYYAIFNVIPIVLNIGVSFTQWRGVFQRPQWVGFDNYLRYLEPPYPLILFNTALFAVTALVLQTVLAFFIAIALNQKLRARGLYRALWYIPTLTSAAIMAQIALIFISPYDGVINAVRSGIGLAPVIWPLEGNWMRLFLVLFQVWRGVGVPVVLFLAALQGIHQELYDAAEVDGAGGRQMMRFITLPLLRPMILFIAVTGMINSFQIFEAALLFTRGGPANLTNVLLLQIYNDAFTNFNLGIAGAGSVILALLLLGFSIAGLRLMTQETEHVR